MGTAEPAGKRAGEVAGGYVVSGTWDYCSGIAHATHFMGNALVAGTADQIAVVIFAAAGSSAAKRGSRLQRYYRDVAMYQGHIASQYLATAGELARVHFGLPDSLF